MTLEEVHTFARPAHHQELVRESRLTPLRDGLGGWQVVGIKQKGKKEKELMSTKNSMAIVEGKGDGWRCKRAWGNKQ